MKELPDDLNMTGEQLVREVRRLHSIITDAGQRLNESGTGQMGLLETIHATHDILRRVETR